MKTAVCLLAAAAGALTADAAAVATIRNVPVDYPTIQQAVNASYIGDTVIIAPGTYTEMINLYDQHLPSIISRDPDDPAIVAATILQGGITLSSWYSPQGTVRLSGLTILGDGLYLGWSSPQGIVLVANNIIAFGYTGVLVDSINLAEVRIINNRIEDTTYGILSQGGAGSDTLVMNNLLAWNDVGLHGAIGNASHNDLRHHFVAAARLEGEGAFHSNYVGRNLGVGVQVFGLQPFTVHNNFIVANRDGLLLGKHTFAINNTIAANTGVGVAFAGYGLDAVRNCIIYANGTAVTDPLGTPNIAYSCSNVPLAGVGNFVADPLFAEAAAGDYHLTPASPCINRGDPGYDWNPAVFDYDGDLRVIGGRLDVGADETAAASTPVPGDMNGDGVLDGLDIPLFVQALLSQ